MAKVDDYLTVGEAAQLLGVSKDTLRRWDRARKLCAHRHPITGYRLYMRRELERFLASIRKRPSKGSR
jgi:excisionase family DNA binding protein